MDTLDIRVPDELTQDRSGAQRSAGALDLDRSAELQKVTPTLKRVLSERHRYGDEVRASRHRWLKRLDTSAVPDA